MSRRPAAIAAVLAIATAGAAAAGIEVPEPLVAGRDVIVRLEAGGSPVSGAVLTAIYHPRSRVAREETVGVSGADGSLAWTPRAAGLVRLRAEPAAGAGELSRDLAVRFAGVPPPGVLTLVLAAAILGSGLVAGLRSGRPG